ncbi:MAG: PAS domain-containing protein [Prochloraceae cyanobacterium]
MQSEIQSPQAKSLKEIYPAQKIPQKLGKDIRLYSLIIDALPYIIWVKDTDGVYLACNHRCKDFFGASEQEILGKTDYDFFNPRLANLFRDQDKEVILKGFESINEEWITFANDRHRELLEIRRLPFYDNNGKPIAILGIGNNVTAGKESEAKLQKSEKLFSLAMGEANDGL